MVCWIIGIAIGVYELIAIFLTLFWVYVDPRVYRFQQTFLYAQFWLVWVIPGLRSFVAKIT